jgi:hypothetical protein
MDFTESLTLELPQIKPQLTELTESDGNAKRALVIELAAIHEGLTANYNKYSAKELEKALESWVAPYPKPVIQNHDLYNEPLGRIMAARMDKETDGSPFTRLQIAVLDQQAMEKVLDQRYLTGSVGGRAEHALCSVCGTDWATAEMFSLPCRHQRGKVYKGQLCYMEMKDIGFKEYSFVNSPADSRSTVRTIGGSTEDTGTDKEENEERWVKAHILSVDMNKESVMELSESGVRNVLTEMKRKDASPYYHVLRGSFLTTIALSEAESEENEMGKTDDEDILAVTESLNADLSVLEEENTAPEAEEEETPEEGAAEDSDESAEDADDSASEEEEDASNEDADAEKDENDSDEDGKEDEESEVPEGQEKPHGADADTAPTKDRESDEEDGNVEESEESGAADESDDTDERISALETEIANLSEENAKLRSALKRGLAERVVDTKIALGLVTKDQRSELIDEHVSRTASSLADSLRDLAVMAPKEVVTAEGAPVVEATVGGVGGEEDKVITSESDETEQPSTPQEQYVDTMVDALMGRIRIN